MALSDYDRELIQRCLARAAGAWEDFADRFIGLVTHVVTHSADARNIRLERHDVEDHVAEVFLQIIKNDFAVLRRFQGRSSLATYITVIARRVVVREFISKKLPQSSEDSDAGDGESDYVVAFRMSLDTGTISIPDDEQSAEQQLINKEHIDSLLAKLSDQEASVMRLFHMEGKSYDEISSLTGMPSNSIGPTLTRARAKLSSQES